MKSKPSNARWILPTLGMILTVLFVFKGGVDWQNGGIIFYAIIAIVLGTLLGLAIWGLDSMRGTPPSAQYQPGWYPDAKNPQVVLRWHDGTSWTQDTTQNAG